MRLFGKKDQTGAGERSTLEEAVKPTVLAQNAVKISKLQKRSRHFARWRERWCLLAEDGRFYTFKSEDFSQKPTEVIDLEYFYISPDPRQATHFRLFRKFHADIPKSADPPIDGVEDDDDIISSKSKSKTKAKKKALFGPKKVVDEAADEHASAWHQYSSVKPGDTATDDSKTAEVAEISAAADSGLAASSGLMAAAKGSEELPETVVSPLVVSGSRSQMADPPMFHFKGDLEDINEWIRFIRDHEAVRFSAIVPYINLTLSAKMKPDLMDEHSLATGARAADDASDGGDGTPVLDELQLKTARFASKSVIRWRNTRGASVMALLPSEPKTTIPEAEEVLDSSSVLDSSKFRSTPFTIVENEDTKAAVASEVEVTKILAKDGTIVDAETSSDQKEDAVIDSAIGDAKEEGGEEAKEQPPMVAWIDESAVIPLPAAFSYYLPVPTSIPEREICNRLRDGVIFALMLNAIVPDCVDVRYLNARPLDLLTAFNKKLQLAVDTAVLSGDKTAAAAAKMEAESESTKKAEVCIMAEITRKIRENILVVLSTAQSIGIPTSRFKLEHFLDPKSAYETLRDFLLHLIDYHVDAMISLKRFPCLIRLADLSTEKHAELEQVLGEEWLIRWVKHQTTDKAVAEASAEASVATVEEDEMAGGKVEEVASGKSVVGDSEVGGGGDEDSEDSDGFVHVSKSVGVVDLGASIRAEDLRDGALYCRLLHCGTVEEVVSKCSRHLQMSALEVRSCDRDIHKLILATIFVLIQESGSVSALAGLSKEERVEMHMEHLDGSGCDYSHLLDEVESAVSWLRSVCPDEYIYKIDRDLCDGVTLLRVVERIAVSLMSASDLKAANGSVVNWSKVKLTTKTQFDKVVNCSILLQTLQTSEPFKGHIHVVGIDGGDLAQCKMNAILSVVSQLQRFHTLKTLSDLRFAGRSVSDAQIRKWANELVTKQSPVRFTVQHMGDDWEGIKKWSEKRALSTGLYFYDLLACVDPSQIVARSIYTDFELKPELGIDEAVVSEKRNSNLLGVMSVIRKLGGVVFVSTADVVSCKPQATLTLAATILALGLRMAAPKFMESFEELA